MERYGLDRLQEVLNKIQIPIFNFQIPMNFQNDNKPNPKYNLEERTAKFAEQVITLMRKVPYSPINKRLVEQLVGSAGSIGANYCEANESESRKDFIHKIGITKKETKETKHWLRLLMTANPEYNEELQILWKECQELLLIFSAIIKSSRSNTKV
jgi:four helix bundle protein